MTMPNFLVIGGARCGTTSLHYYLGEHPDIFMASHKDCRFFAMGDEPMPAYLEEDEPARARFDAMRRDAVLTPEAYRALFDEVADETAVGEATAFYLYHPRAPERIRRTIPDARLVAVLRQPAERAYSHYLARVRNGSIDRSFEEVLDAEDPADERVWAGQFHFIREGFYYRNLKRYYDLFPADQFRIFLFEELQGEPERLVRDICRFLGVRDDVPLDVAIRYNAAGRPKSQAINRLLMRRNPLKSAVKWLIPQSLRTRLRFRVMQKNAAEAEMAPDVRKRLIDVFRDDILRLQDLIGRDLSHWLR